MNNIGLKKFTHWPEMPKLSFEELVALDPDSDYAPLGPSMPNLGLQLMEQKSGAQTLLEEADQNLALKKAKKAEPPPPPPKKQKVARKRKAAVNKLETAKNLKISNKVKAKLLSVVAKPSSKKKTSKKKTFSNVLP